MVRLIALVVLLVACDDGAREPAAPTTSTTSDYGDVFEHNPDPQTQPLLDARQTLVRLSLDLRGVRPTPDEMARVEGPDAEAQLAQLTNEFLADARFPDRVRDLFAMVLRTRVEDFPVMASELGLDQAEQPALFAAIGEETLQVIAKVAAEDRPWTDIVTADWTMANRLLAKVFPLAFDGPAPSDARAWAPAHYTDGRPAAGLLATNGLWWRYLSDGVNYGRGRANAIARIFLCADFLDRPIDFPRDIDLTDEEGIRAAVRENQGCIGCHSGMDPLASYLAGFQYTDKTASELLVYHPERERQWRDMTELAPGFYGHPGYSLRDLAVQLAGDPRFVSCAVETTFELIMRRPVDYADPREVDALTTHREAFLHGGLTLRALIRSIVADPRYRLADSGDPKTAEKLVTPDQWGDMLEAWTGYRMTVGGADMLATDLTGLRTLAGGGDGRAGAEPATLPTTTMALVWERTAEAAASYAVEHPFVAPDERTLFALDLDAAPAGPAFDDAAMRAQVVALHRRLFGTTVADDALEVKASLALWDRLATIDGPRGAWRGLLTALLRDPSLVLY